MADVVQAAFPLWAETLILYMLIVLGLAMVLFIEYKKIFKSVNTFKDFRNIDDTTPLTAYGYVA